MRAFAGNQRVDVSTHHFLDSPYRGALSEAVLQMQESGEITSMKIKWWKEKRGGGACAVRIEFSFGESIVLTCTFQGHRRGGRR